MNTLQDILQSMSTLQETLKEKLLSLDGEKKIVSDYNAYYYKYYNGLVDCNDMPSGQGTYVFEGEDDTIVCNGVFHEGSFKHGHAVQFSATLENLGIEISDDYIPNALHMSRFTSTEFIEGAKTRFEHETNTGVFKNSNTDEPETQLRLQYSNTVFIELDDSSGVAKICNKKISNDRGI